MQCYFFFFFFDFFFFFFFYQLWHGYFIIFLAVGDFAVNLTHSRQCRLQLLDVHPFHISFLLLLLRFHILELAFELLSQRATKLLLEICHSNKANFSTASPPAHLRSPACRPTASAFDKRSVVALLRVIFFFLCFTLCR